MAYKVQKPCKVCGKLYTPCSDCERDKTAFHWRTVACSIQCGMEYFRRVEEARNPKVILEEVAVEETISVEEVVNNIESENEVKVYSSRKKNKKFENKEESE